MGSDQAPRQVLPICCDAFAVMSASRTPPRLDVEPGNEAAPRDPDSIRAAMDTSCLRAVRICLRQLGPGLLVKQLVTVLAQEHE